MNKHPNHTNIQRSALSALKDICAHAGDLGKDYIMEAYGMETIGRAVQFHSDNSQIKELAGSVMGEMLKSRSALRMDS